MMLNSNKKISNHAFCRGDKKSSLKIFLIIHSVIETIACRNLWFFELNNQNRNFNYRVRWLLKNDVKTLGMCEQTRRCQTGK